MPDRRFIHRLTGAILLAALALSACAPKPEAVAEKLVAAVNARDVEGALALFAEDAVVDTGGPAPYTGTAEIRGWLEQLASDNFQIKAQSLEVDGDTVVETEEVSMDPWKEMDIFNLEGVRRIQTRNGLIQSLEFSLTEVSRSDLQVATLRSARPTHTDLAYGESNPEQVLDLYLPQTGTPPYPVILMIHGIGDEKEQHNSLAGFFNQSGFAAVVIDYLDEDSQRVPDGLCALAWTKANAGEYGLDPDRITVFGYSVGGLIASMIGTLDDRAAALQSCGYTLPDQGGILGVAIYEGILGTPEGCFSAGWCPSGGRTASESLPIFESLRTTDPAMWKDTGALDPQAQELARQFPLYWLDGSEPPFLLVHGSGEEGLPQIESQAFAKRLEEAGVDVQLLLLPTGTHWSVFQQSLPSFYQIAEAVVEFAGRLGAK
jgi:acetyl esterase/lipase